MPAGLSNDGTTVYIAVSQGTAGYLVALDSTTLARTGNPVRLR